MPKRELLCGSRIFEERGALKITLPENLVESLELKSGDWIIWRNYCVSSKGKTIIKGELSRGEDNE